MVICSFGIVVILSLDVSSCGRKPLRHGAFSEKAPTAMLKCAENAYNLQSGKAPHCGALWATRGENASGSLSCTFIEQAGSQRISP
jgi:hypothetical protein